MLSHPSQVLNVNSVSSQSGPVTGQPASITCQPAFSSGQPISSIGQPASTTSQPVATTSQPALASNQPALTTSQSASSTSQPASTTSRPISATSQPASSDQPSQFFFQLNVNSVKNSLAKLNCFLQNNKIRIACLQETRLSAKSKDPSFPNYMVFEKRPSSREWGDSHFGPSFCQPHSH
jgi:hypothetical protein